MNRLSRQIRWELDNMRYNEYSSYVESFVPGDARLWRETKRLTGQTPQIPPLAHGTGTATTDIEKCEVFAEHLSRKFRDYDRLDQQTDDNVDNYLTTPTTTVEPLIPFVSPAELKSHIRRLPRKKAPGDDLIPNIVLKQLPRKTIALLASIYNACLRFGYYPQAWKNAMVLLFHKKGKPKHDPDSYRPISLLNTLGKLLEKVIEKRLRLHLDSNNVIPHHQFGFRQHHAATHQAQRVAQCPKIDF